MTPILLRLSTGRRIDLARPRVEDISIRDISRGLSNVCRYAGQIPSSMFYSVAQHSVLVSDLCMRPCAKHGLLHDASEAYIGDVTRNLKHSDYMVGYRMIELVLQTTIESRFKIDMTDSIHRHVKAIDDLVACYERIVIIEQQEWRPEFDLARLVREGFVKHSAFEMMAFVGGLPETFTPLPPREAEEQFLDRFISLFEDRP